MQKMRVVVNVYIYRHTRDYFVWSSIRTKNCQFIRRQWSSCTKDARDMTCHPTFMR